LNSQHIPEKSSKIKIHENLSNGSKVAPCEWTDRHMKLTVTFCNIVHVPKKGIYSNMVATVNNKPTTKQENM